MSAVTNDKLKTLPKINENSNPKQQETSAQKAKQIVNPFILEWALNDGKIKRNLPVNTPIWRREVK